MKSASLTGRVAKDYVLACLEDPIRDTHEKIGHLLGLRYRFPEIG
jgi:hypothetical protein